MQTLFITNRAWNVVLASLDKWLFVFRVARLLDFPKPKHVFHEMEWNTKNLYWLQAKIILFALQIKKPVLQMLLMLM